LDELTRRVDAVDAEQVLELAAELFDPAGLSVAGVGTQKDVFNQAFSNGPLGVSSR
jgi:predicted Zn-dependent peptidase